MIPKRDISSDVVLIRLIDVGCLLLPIFSQKISCDGQSQLLSVHQCCLLHKHLLQEHWDAQRQRILSSFCQSSATGKQLINIVKVDVLRFRRMRRCISGSSTFLTALFSTYTPSSKVIKILSTLSASLPFFRQARYARYISRLDQNDFSIHA